MSKPTNVEMKRTLEMIARYPIPFFTTADGKKLVPLKNVEDIVKFARNVLRWKE